MFTIIRSTMKPSSLVQLQKALLSTSQIQCASQNPLLQMGPYPRTPEQRERAARKYNLIPEDYEPFEEGEGWGDYPNLKPVGDYNKDPYDDFDDPKLHRFYGEVLHIDAHMYDWYRIDPYAHEKERVPMWLAYLTFLSFFFITPGCYLFFKKYRIQINHNWKKRLHHPPDQKYYEFPSSSHH